MDSIRAYQKRVFSRYCEDIGLSDTYVFPEGNRIRPLPPIHTQPSGVMIVGAYPSAKFERFKGESGRWRTIPVANNLSPFNREEYFDGLSVRQLVSGEMLEHFHLAPLGLSLSNCWVTDLVKVFLYKDTHAGAINDVFPDFRVPTNRTKFEEYGRLSMPYFEEEIHLAQPKLIITLGEEVARVVLGNKKNGKG